MIDDKDILEALDRIAQTADGRMLYLFLQKVLCRVPSIEHSDGALREFEGGRRFAAELMGHMSQGIQESDRTAITFSVTRAARTGPGTSASAYWREQRAAAALAPAAPVAGASSDGSSAS